MLDIEDFVAKATFCIDKGCGTVFRVSYKGLAISVNSNEGVFQISNPSLNEDLAKEMNEQKLTILLLILLYGWGWQEPHLSQIHNFDVLVVKTATDDTLMLLFEYPYNKLAFERGLRDALDALASSQSS